MRFVEAIDEIDVDGEVYVNNTGCFRICDKGPIDIFEPKTNYQQNIKTLL